MAINKKGNKDRDRIKKALDAALPMGVRTGFHQSPQASASELNAEGFNRAANQTFMGPGMSPGGSASNVPGVSRTPLMYIDPMFDPILFLFPKDRIDEINKRLRHYYETDAIVGSAIDMHTSFPLSDFHLECENEETQRYWNDFKDRTGLLEYLRNLVHDYWLLGEGIGLPIWDEYNFEFSHFNQYPPENVDVMQTYVTPRKYFLLKPDPRLSEKIRSGSAIDATLSKMMDPAYVDALAQNKPYLLGSDEKVMYLARQVTKYRNRGVSLLSRVLKDLLYKDKLRLLQLTFVDRHMFPIKIFKLGSEQRGWIPNQRHFQRLDALLKQASNDPDFSIIHHFGLNVEYVGTKDKIANLTPEFDWVQKQVMAGLFVNDEIIHGGMPSAVRDTVNMRALMYRYLDVREKIERMMITHIFLPIARARGFYRKGGLDAAKKHDSTLKRVAGKDEKISGEFLDADKKHFRVANSHSSSVDLSVYDLPRPIWKKLNLVNNVAEQQIMLQLEADGKIPLEMVLDMLGVDPRTVREKLKRQESTEFDPVWRKIRDAMSQDKNIQRQILGGAAHQQWTVSEGAEIEVGAPAAPGAKKPASPIGAPSGGGARPPAPPPPPPVGAKPSLDVKKPPVGPALPVVSPVGPVPPIAGGTPPPATPPAGA